MRKLIPTLLLIAVVSVALIKILPSPRRVVGSASFPEVQPIQPGEASSPQEYQPGGEDPTRENIAVAKQDAELANKATNDVCEIGQKLLTSKSWIEAQSLVYKLKAIGSDAAIAAILEFARDKEPFFTHKADLMATILLDVDDPRIPDSMVEALHAGIDAGHDTWEVAGYARLVASKGSPQHVMVLMQDLLSDAIGIQLRLSIAESLALTKDPEIQDMVLAEMKASYARGDTSLAATLATSLASYGNELASKEILGIARSQDLNNEARRSAYSAWGSGLDPADAHLVWQEYTTSTRAQQVCVLSAFCAIVERNPSARVTLFSESKPMIQNVLIDGSDESFLTLLSLIGDNLDSVPAGIANALRSASTRALEETYRRRALDYADQIQDR